MSSATPSAHLAVVVLTVAPGLLRGWAGTDPHPYPAGSADPEAAHALLARDRRRRHEETP